MVNAYTVFETPASGRDLVQRPQTCGCGSNLYTKEVDDLDRKTWECLNCYAKTTRKEWKVGRTPRRTNKRKAFDNYIELKAQWPTGDHPAMQSWAMNEMLTASAYDKHVTKFDVGHWKREATADLAKALVDRAARRAKA